MAARRGRRPGFRQVDTFMDDFTRANNRAAARANRRDQRRAQREFAEAFGMGRNDFTMQVSRSNGSRGH